jgi:hypothetical protein
MPDTTQEVKRLKSNAGFMSLFFERLRSAYQSGLQHGGTRDMYNTFGWKRSLEFADFAAKYDRQDIAGRVVDSYPDACWSDPPRVEGGDTFNKAWQALTGDDSQVPVFAALSDLDKLSRLGRYAIMIIGYDDGTNLAQPVPVSTRERKLVYLQPYAEDVVQIKEYETRQNNPRFGMPTIYTIMPGAIPVGEGPKTPLPGTQNMSPTSFDVHASRVLHVADGIRGSRVFGRSCLEPIYNILDDLLKVTGGASETFWLTGNRGLHVDIDKDMTLAAEAEDDLAAEIEEYESQLRRIIRTRGVKINSLGSEVADPRGVFDVLLSLLSARTGIPKRILAGSEAGQLASSQDRAEWACRVGERTSRHTEPYIFKPFLFSLIGSNVLPKPEGLNIDWADPYKQSPLERSQTSAQMARSVANLAKALVQPVPVGDGTANVAPLLSIDEARAVISFGKHQPKFDKPAQNPAPPAQPGGSDNPSEDDGHPTDGG